MVLELVDQLVPDINTLKSHIKRVATFHDPVHLHTNMLSSTLNDTIINCISIPIRQTFFKFKGKNARNLIVSNIFHFISEDLSKMASNYTRYLLEYDEIL